MFKRTVTTVNTTTDALLDRAKEVLSVHSDYQLAKVLGVTSQHLNGWRKHRSAPEAAIAVRLAEILGQPPLQLIALIEEERELSRKSPRAAIVELWKRYLPRILPTIITAAVVGIPTPGRHAQAPGHNSVNPVYIMRTLVRRKKKVWHEGWTPA